MTTVSDITALKQAQLDIEKANQALANALETQSAELSEQRLLADRLLATMNSVDLRILLFDKDEKLIFANDQYALKNPWAAELLNPGVSYEDFMREAVSAGLYPDAIALVLFPPYNAEDIIAAAEHQAFLPPGVSRHIIQGRALKLNYPLHYLENMETSLEEKNQHLQDWIREKLANRSVRYYAESTYQFDE